MNDMIWTLYCWEYDILVDRPVNSEGNIYNGHVFMNTASHLEIGIRLWSYLEGGWVHQIILATQRPYDQASDNDFWNIEYKVEV